MARSQEQRKAETRRRLLEAAAELFAERGIEGVSIDAVADAADRTSGAVYAHFGGKAGLLTALVDFWKSETAAVIAAEFGAATTLDSRLHALWRNFVDPPSPEGPRWVQLEHELWLYASRHPHARSGLADRYSEAREQLAAVVGLWAAEGDDPLAVPADRLPALLIGLLVGLEMQHRLDPASVPDEMAVAGLRSLLGARPGEPVPSTLERQAP